MIDHILVRRLILEYKPLHHLFDLDLYTDPVTSLITFPKEWDSRKWLLKKILSHKPWTTFLEVEDRTDDYHWGRIRFFYEESIKGRKIKPISLDNRCAFGRVYPEIVMDDGHHRLMGLFLAGAPTIPAFYGGRVYLLNWLKGKSRKRPTD